MKYVYPILLLLLIFNTAKYEFFPNDPTVAEVKVVIEKAHLEGQDVLPMFRFSGSKLKTYWIPSEEPGIGIVGDKKFPLEEIKAEKERIFKQYNCGVCHD